MLRSQYTLALILTLAIATGFFYTNYQTVCAIPLTYSISSIDEQFGLSAAEAAVVITEAVAVWEEGVEQNVFEPAAEGEAADVHIDFIFDERQARTEAEARERERLAVVEALSGEVQSTYQQKVATLTAAEAAYEAAAAQYERDLARYNQTVADYNAEGGAPPEVYESLAAEAQRLERIAAELITAQTSINAQIAEINSLGKEGNAIISRFNDRVVDFNTMFADGREFTQGDYQDGVIRIYSFSDQTELKVVLIHELGHALGVDHVESPTAFMHYLLGEQRSDGDLHSDDIAAFTARCSREAKLARLPQPWRTVFAWFIE